MNNHRHTHLARRPRLGVDIGRVILGTASLGGGADTSFLSGGDDAAMATPAGSDPDRHSCTRRCAPAPRWRR